MNATPAPSIPSSDGTLTDLAKLVRKLREGRGWSQEALAEASDLSLRTIQRIESGDPANLQTKRSLARGFALDDVDALDKPWPSPKYIVWFVDDLKEKREAFRTKHMLSDILVETFNDPDEVMQRLDGGSNLPDAIFIDVFFYEDKTEHFPEKTPEEVEKIVERVIEQLRNQWFAHEKYARGILLMERISSKIQRGELPPIVRYAYTTKAPYLLELKAWDRIHKSGATVLIKNSLVAGDERSQIREDVSKNKETWRSRVGKGVREAVQLTNLGKLVVGGVVTALAGGVAGFVLKSWISTPPC